MPAVVVIVMAVCKCPSIPTLMVSTLVAVVLAMLVQGQSLSGILNILDSGFSIDTALPEFKTLAIVVGGRMYIGEFKKKNLLPQTLSRTLEDSGTIISPLVPWSLCGAYMAGTLGVSTMSYLPFAMFCWLCPVLAIVYGFTGKFFWKTGEKSSQKVYQLSTLMEAS